MNAKAEWDRLEREWAERAAPGSFVTHAIARAKAEWLLRGTPGLALDHLRLSDALRAALAGDGWRVEDAASTCNITDVVLELWER